MIVKIIPITKYFFYFALMYYFDFEVGGHTVYKLFDYSLHGPRNFYNTSLLFLPIWIEFILSTMSLFLNKIEHFFEQLILLNTNI